MDALCHDLAARGIPAWNIEYRRVGQGGGSPMSLIDVGAATEGLLDLLSSRHPLDLARLFAIGHSAGGHLALWTAARHRLRRGARGPIRWSGRRACSSLPGSRICVRAFGKGPATTRSMSCSGGRRTSWPIVTRTRRLRSSCRSAYPGPRSWQIADADVDPSITDAYAERARAAGDSVTEVRLDGFDHFDVIDPKSAIWQAALDAVSALRRRSPA